MALLRKPAENHLLAAFPQTKWNRFAPHLEIEELALERVFYTPGSAQTCVYFPLDCIIALLYVMEDWASACSACGEKE